MARKLTPPDPVERPYDNDATHLPDCLKDAVTALHNSDFYRASLGSKFVDYDTHIKLSEWNRYLTTVSEWEEREYFSLF